MAISLGILTQHFQTNPYTSTQLMWCANHTWRINSLHYVRSQLRQFGRTQGYRPPETKKSPSAPFVGFQKVRQASLWKTYQVTRMKTKSDVCHLGELLWLTSVAREVELKGSNPCYSGTSNHSDNTGILEDILRTEQVDWVDPHSIVHQSGWDIYFRPMPSYFVGQPWCFVVITNVPSKVKLEA